LRSALDAGLSELDTRAPRAQRVVVVGGGMAGISTAYFLARAGNAVTVLEAAPAPVAPASASAATSSVPLIPGTAASYTGLLSPSTSLAPFFARPHIYRAQKVQWCPKTLYMHPNFRVGLFDSGAVARHVRMGVTPYAKRQTFQQSLVRLYGLAMWNQALEQHISREWAQQDGKQAQAERIPGTLAVVFDDHTFADLLADVKRHRLLVGDEVTDIMPTVAASSSASPPSAAAAASSSMVPSSGRLYALDDRSVLQQLPSLLPKQFTMAGVLHAQDEYAIDHLAFLQRLREDSQRKYGVQYVYDTTVTALVTEQQQQQQSQPSSAASNDAAVVPAAPSSRIAYAATSRGPVTGDAFVLCAGARSKTLVHASHLPGIAQAVPTFTTKTHYVAFPNPDSALPATGTAAAANAVDRLFPRTSVSLPESQTVLTPFTRQVRVSIGNDFNALDEPVLPRATDAAAAREEAATAERALPLQPHLDPSRLQSLLKEVSSVFPRADKSVVSGGGRSVPGASLRTWSFDGKPLLGQYASATTNLFVNGAHGHLGWSHALAAGQHVSSIVSRLPTFLQGDAFDPRRFSNSK
jgi:glycine/D-amino acid oxidase-like deaminating enzyme